MIVMFEIFKVILIFFMCSLNDLAEFIKVTSAGMAKQVKGYDGLVEVSVTEYHNLLIFV